MTEEGVQVVPLKLGLITSPPCLVLIYKTCDPVTKEEKKRKRRCPLRNFNDKSDIEKYTFTIKQRHANFLGPIPTITIQKMLRIIQEIEKGEEVDEAVKKVDKQYEVSGEKDLNKVSIDELMKTKEKMDETYLKNIITPEDPSFIYDKRIDFEATAVYGINHNKIKESIENDWDDDDDEEGDKNEDNQPQFGLFEIASKDKDQDREKEVERDYKSGAEPEPKPILDPFEDGKLDVLKKVNDMDMDKEKDDEDGGIMSVKFQLKDLDIDQLKDGNDDEFVSKTKKIEIDTLNFDFDDKDIEEDVDDDFWK